MEGFPMKKYRICLFFILIAGIFVSSALGYTVGRQRGMALERARQEEQTDVTEAGKERSETGTGREQKEQDLPQTLPEDHEASNQREVTAGRVAAQTGQKKTEDAEDLEVRGKAGKEGMVGEKAGAGREAEQEYYLVAEDGFLLVFLKDRKTICLYTHLPLMDFSVSEQERLREGIWFSSMIEVFNYLESCTS